MIKRFYATGFIVIALSLFYSGSFAQNNYGTIKGVVTTSDGQPAQYITINIEQLAKGRITNEKGEYIIRNVPKGNYTIKISAVGVISQEKEIALDGGQTLVVDFSIRESFSQLEEVIIQSNYNKAQSSEDVAKIPLKNIENPQVYSVVTKELLTEQLVTDVRQAFKNMPGVTEATDPAGGINVMSRGFFTPVGARNGLPFVAAGRSSLDFINIESIEVLKGPSGTLFGNAITSYGGVVNMVTKKPFDTFRGEVGYSTGSYGLQRVTADINAPLNKEKTVLFRATSALHKQFSFLTDGHTNRFSFNPSVLYKASDRLTLSLDVEAYNEDLNKIQYYSSLDALGINNVKDIPVKYNQSFFGNSFNAKAFTTRTYGRAEYKISDQWTSVTDVAVANENIDHSYQGYISFLSHNTVMREGGDFGPIRTAVTDVQHNLKGDFKLGGLRNRLVWGIDYVSYYQKRNSRGTAILDTIDITQPISAINEMEMSYAYAHVTGTGYNTEYKFQQLASYVSDVVNITDNLMALASVRFDRYMLAGDYGYNQNSWTPRFGLVYQPVKDHVSLFGNYMSGFTNNGIGTQPDGSVFVFKPSFARQWEGGVKINAFQNRISGSISYYTININDAPRSDPDGTLHQDGKQTSKGIDVDLRASLAKGLSVTAGYGYNRNKYIKSDYAEGKLVSESPKNVANIWVSYRFSGDPVLQHFGIGAGVNYAGDCFLDDANTIGVPAYTYINGTLFYESSAWRLGIALDNISNEHYWNAFATPQAPRNVTANITFKF